MNEIAKKEDLISTSQFAKQLGTSSKVVLENAKKCLPNKVIEKGKSTYWTKEEVTVVLEQMKQSNPNQSTFTGAVKEVSTELTPALKIKKALELMQEGYEEELAILREKNMLLEADNHKLAEDNMTLYNALEYDKVKDCHKWSDVKKALGISSRVSFESVASVCDLEENKDYYKKVMGKDKYPTIMLTYKAEMKIKNYYS